MSLLDDVTIPAATDKPWVLKKKLQTAATRLLKKHRPKTRRGSGSQKRKQKEQQRTKDYLLFKKQEKLLAAQRVEFERLIAE